MGDMEKVIPMATKRRPGRPRGSGGDDGGERSVLALDRGLALLELLADRPDGLAFTEAVDSLPGVPGVTVHRLLRTLVGLGFVRDDGDGARYQLGGRFMHLAGRSLHQRTQLRSIAKPFLQELVDRTGETANLATLDGTEASFLDQVQSQRMVRAGTFLRSPLHCSGTGKSLLAFQDGDTADEIIRRLPFGQLTEHTLTEVERLRAELARVRRQGYSVDDEEMEIGTRCIAAPVVVDGAAVAAISIAGPTTRITADQVRPLSTIVRDVAERLSVSVAEAFPGLRAGELMERFVG
jgi:IclR family acetate operon transcriptional repressor